MKRSEIRGRPIGFSGTRIALRSMRATIRAPSFNTNRDQSLASMERLAAILASTKAQLWIHHDKPQFDSQTKSPEFYD